VVDCDLTGSQGRCSEDEVLTSYDKGSPMGKSATFQFDGGAATYLGVGILSFLITFFTFGIALPYALVLKQRWKATHTFIGGRRLKFVGSGTSLFLSWIKWLLLILLTLGIYGFWVMPRVTKWIVENTDFDDAAMPAGMAPVPVAVT
jgi:uncharacterized membrane protein YjgN (DUF898 family)